MGGPSVFGSPHLPFLLLCQGGLVSLLDVKSLKSENDDSMLFLVVFFFSFPLVYVLPLYYSLYWLFGLLASKKLISRQGQLYNSHSLNLAAREIYNKFCFNTAVCSYILVCRFSVTEL